MLPRLERRSVLTGALVTIVLAVPPAVIGLLLSEDDTMAGSSWVPVMFSWIMVAFFVGGLVAARAQPHAPSAHGAAAALLGYGLVQGVGVARHLVTGEDLSWLSIVFSALLAASIGTVGGIVANGLRARRSRATP
jgi:hypothetical protein